MKAYRFFSFPGNIVNDGNTGLPMLRFDEKGEYITLDPILAKRMAVHFENKEIELVESKSEETIAKAYKCKKCDFETDNKGTLAAHYKKDHPKEG